MVTKVGMQSSFADAMKDLLGLEYDALSAYVASIERLEDQNYKSKMLEFGNDHKRHIEEITVLLEDHEIDFVAGPDAKGLLAKGKVVIAGLLGDQAILMAMITNEADTNTAYERLNKHIGIWEDAIDVLKRGYADERKHKAWLENNVE